MLNRKVKQALGGCSRLCVKTVCSHVQYISGWSIGIDTLKNNVNHNLIVLVMLTIRLVVCVILASIDLTPLLLISLKQPT